MLWLSLFVCEQAQHNRREPTPAREKVILTNYIARRYLKEPTSIIGKPRAYAGCGDNSHFCEEFSEYQYVA
jgi:hypothetical protein